MLSILIVNFMTKELKNKCRKKEKRKMSRNCYIINGKEDDELTTAGLWYALSYLYSKNIDPSEKRFEFANNQEERIRAIQSASQRQIKYWLDYAIHDLKKKNNKQWRDFDCRTKRIREKIIYFNVY